MGKLWHGSSGRLLAELGVVFLGVLIALVADSWWKSLDDRRRETAYLEAIQSDMSDAIDALSVAISEDSTFMLGAERELEILRGDPAPPGLDLEEFLELYAADVSFPVGSLRALLMTGDLSLVRAEALRSVLIREAADLESEMAWVDEVTSQAGENIQQILVAWEGLEIEARSSGRDLSLEDLRRNREIVGGTVIYVTQMANILSSLRDARGAAGRIKAAIELELASR